MSYISQADALNFLLNLQIWAWYARRSGSRDGLSDRVERRKTFQASSQEERPSMWRFLHWDGTKARVVASWGSTVRVKLFWGEAKEGCGYMLSERSSLKSMYSHWDIFEQSFSGSGGRVGSYSLGTIC